MSVFCIIFLCYHFHVIFLVPHQGNLRESMDLEDFRDKSTFFRNRGGHVNFS